MQEKLIFNICRIETSYDRNDNIPNLDARIQEAIPSSHSYACRFWAGHLRASPKNDSDLRLFQGLVMFLQTRFLY
jgi:hypothetical protein